MRTQRLNRFKPYSPNAHWAVDPAQPHCRYIIWPGDLPNQTTPIHRSIGVQISVGFIGESITWLERCDAEWTIAELPEHMTHEFIQAAEEALFFLHENNHAHGSITPDHLGIRMDGWPIWIGVGIKKGTIDEDLQAWETFKSSWCKRFIGDEVEKSLSPLLKPKAYPLDVEDEVLFEVSQLADRDIRDAPEYNHTPSSSFPEVTHTHVDFNEWTNSIPQADALSSPSSGSIAELLSWMLQNDGSLAINMDSKIHVADMLLPLDQLPVQNDTSLPAPTSWDETEREHTEVMKDHFVKTDPKGDHTDFLHGKNDKSQPLIVQLTFWLIACAGLSYLIFALLTGHSF